MGFLFCRKIFAASVLLMALIGRNVHAAGADSTRFFHLFGVSGGMHKPGGDLAARFGYSGAVAANYLLLHKSNWFVMLDHFMIFSRNVLENDMFVNISTADGNLINQNGEFSKIRLGQRGFCSSARIGKVFQIGNKNSRSGFFLSAGGGYFELRIFIDDVGNLTPSLRGSYKKGYDRLSGGPAICAGAGFLLVSKNRLINGFAAFDMIYGLTQSMRSWNFDTMSRDTRKREDILTGFRLGFMIRIHRRSTDQFYMY
jgi:hypothetical protein